MLIEIQTQSRKKPKLNRFMDVQDLQILLLLGLVVPYLLWWFVGIDFLYGWPPVVLYIAWMVRFKIDRPAGYWKHWLSHQLRGQHWSARNGTITKNCYLTLNQ
jgi:hypothetical protein